ncbi:NAD(P)-binding domain-containing protein, partial [Flavobacteriaceae bacterium]|nr:NAD(P)-binding domain-containing protein [Flavobacteriaceae bacterium]
MEKIIFSLLIFLVSHTSFSQQKYVTEEEFNERISWLEVHETHLYLEDVLRKVPAGEPTDHVINNLLDILDEDDIIIDAGNTNPVVSFNNKLKIQINKMLYLGIGVSGGTEGVLRGPSIMIGGHEAAFNKVKDDLSIITSKTIKNTSSFDFFGDTNQGHFVKMVHNGIEYVE